LGKVIFWIVVFFLVLLALRLVSVYKARDDARDEKANDKTSKMRDDKPADDSMVKCVQCGVFMPKASSLMKAKGWSCRDANCSNRR
jgi:hypothetical protein